MKTDAELRSDIVAERVRQPAGHIGLDPTAPANALKDAVEQRVTREADIDAGHIAVSATRGHVRLTGTVPTAHDRDAAGSEAFAVAGVKSVENDLEVAADGTSHGAPEGQGRPFTSSIVSSPWTNSPVPSGIPPGPRR
jgi:hypothetical protein